MGSDRATLLICSDIHYASEAEKRRRNYETRAIDRPLSRLLVRCYRHFFWLRDPFAHNHLLDHVLNTPVEPDRVVSNGDYSCDSAFIGLADPASRESAEICLGKLRARFKDKFTPVFGDHELGKITLCGGKGGLRLESWRVSREELKIPSVWSERLGNYVLIGVTSSVVAMEVYQHESLPEEREEWLRIAAEHRAQIGSEFEKLKAGDRVILFCHDPTALPFLLEIEPLKKRMSQIEKTVFGHLHSNVIVWQSRILSGIPQITSCGAAIRRMSAALSRAKSWKQFNPMLCPSLAGIELVGRGGYYTVNLDLSAHAPAEFTLHPVKRQPGPPQTVYRESPR